MFEVWFLTGIQDFFFAPRSWENEKHIFQFLYLAQILPSPLSYLQHAA